MPGDASDGYQVRTNELDAHAKNVRQVASQLDQALSAAQQVTMGVQAYGLICGPLFVPMVLAVSTPGLVTLGLAAQAMNDVAGGVTDTVTSYRNVDHKHETVMNTIAEGLR
jgi:hypothetical protein